MERLRARSSAGAKSANSSEELQFHVEMEAEKNQRAGMTADEARRHGHIALGGIERTKEDVRDARGTRLFEDVRGDIAYACRMLVRSPGFAVVAILTLAVGIGGTTAVYSAVDAVLLQPLPYQQPGQLVRLYQYFPDNPAARSFVTPVHMVEYRSRLTSLDAVAGLLTYDEGGADIGAGDDVRRIHLLPVTADYFDVVRVRPLVGGGFRHDDETGAPLVVISHDLWRDQLHSDAAPVGRTLVLSGRAYTVTGVMPAGFTDPVAGKVDAWTPMDLSTGRVADEESYHWIKIVGRLRQGVTIAQAQAEVDLTDVALNAQYPRARGVRGRLYPLKEDIVGSSSRALEVMLGAVALVLVLVCVNVANLFLVRSSERTRELAVRAALGAARTRLVRQMLIESLVLAAAGGIGGLVVARLAMSAIVALGSSSIPRLSSLTLEPRLLIFALGISTACAVGFGLMPALRASRAEPGDALREQGRSSTGGSGQMRLRESLVVWQVALAFVLLVGAGLLLASLRRIGEVDIGVQPANTLVFELHLPAARYDSVARGRFYEVAAKRLEAIPGVQAAGGVSKLPATGAYHDWGVTILTGPLAGTKEANAGAANRTVSGDYFQAAGIPLVDGRLFDSRDAPGAPDHVLVSRNFARRMYPGINAIGQHVMAGRSDCEIIGVVGDVALTPEGGEDGYIYHWHPQFAGDRLWSLVQVVHTTGSDRRAPPAGAPRDRGARSAARRLQADDICRGDRARRGATGVHAPDSRDICACRARAVCPRLVRRAFLWCAAAHARVRDPNGTRRRSGCNSSNGDAPRARRHRHRYRVRAGRRAGALARVMVSLVFKVSPFDPTVLGGAMLFMALIAGVAAYLPARRATSVDPRSVLQ